MSLLHVYERQSWPERPSAGEAEAGRLAVPRGELTVSPSGVVVAVRGALEERLTRGEQHSTTRIDHGW
jgi:hypothetical protein